MGKFCRCEKDPSGKYYDIISYRRELSREETEEYELDFIREETVEEDPLFTTLVVKGEPESC